MIQFMPAVTLNLGRPAASASVRLNAHLFAPFRNRGEALQGEEGGP